MIEAYYDIITKIENFVDGLMIVDEKGIIKYNKQFSEGEFYLNEESSIGKTPMDVFPNLTEQTSTCNRALKYGETTVNQIQKLKYVSGEEFLVIDNTFPIIENGKIIGAVSTSKFTNDNYSKDFIDLSNMTSARTNDLYNISDIIGSSPEIQKLKSQILRISKSNSSVLIYGETGTGKELVAQSIHSHSSRSKACFISQNCAAIPNTLLESIFFGTTKGSYTGAENRPGIFELADGGTIFLDEINSMDVNMQAKLLKAIEEKKITRIGDTKSKKIDVRIIAAINKNPYECLRENLIRNDLFYRLAIIQINVPPLRDRKSDILDLSQYYINYYNKEMKLSISKISDEVIEIFKKYDWPGNVREFRNVIEGAFNFSTSGIIQKEDLPDFIHINQQRNDIDNSNLSLNEALNNFEKEFIVTHSKNTKNLTELADKLKITKQNLNYKLKKYNLKF